MRRHQQQLSLFDRPTLNVGRAVKDALNRAARESGLSREQLVDRMNELAERHGVHLTRGNGRRLTLEVFEKWLNPADLTRQMPLKALPVFCAAAGDRSALEALAAPLGLRVIGSNEQRRLEWADAKLAVKAANRRIRQIEAEL